MCKKNAAEQPEKFGGVRRTPRNPKDEDCRRNSFRLKPKTGIDPKESVCVSPPCFSVSETIFEMRTILNNKFVIMPEYLFQNVIKAKEDCFYRFFR